ncbi:MAG TPA: LysR substrate-binding domain-containing protein [Jiangellaceae bacterium]
MDDGVIGRGCVAAGLGVAFVPALATSAVPPPPVSYFADCPPQKPPPVASFAATARARHSTPAVAEFVTLLKREAPGLDSTTPVRNPERI